MVRVKKKKKHKSAQLFEAWASDICGPAWQPTSWQSGKVGQSQTFGQYCRLAYYHTWTWLCRPPITVAQLSLLLVCTPAIRYLHSTASKQGMHDSVVSSWTCCRWMLVIAAFRVFSPVPHLHSRPSPACRTQISWFLPAYLVFFVNEAKFEKHYLDCSFKMK